MKRLLPALILILIPWSCACAQDELAREPAGMALRAPTYWNWSGSYIGGQGGYSFANAAFGNASNAQIAYILRDTFLESIVSNWTTMPSGDTSNFNYGAFIGFNAQWEDLILGAEANYSRSQLSAASSAVTGPILVHYSGTPPSGHDYSYSVTTSSNASVTITDILTLRGRAGWAAGPLLPYGFVGAAFGRADVSRSASVSALLYDTDTTTSTTTISAVALPSSPQQEVKDGNFVYGFTGGFGVDTALLPNIFLRAEWEYVQFPSIKGVNVTINSARAGIGIKF